MHPLPRVSLALTLAVIVAACPADRAPNPPPAEFLLGAGDSTFWVRSDGNDITVRGSPILLAAFDGRFYEVYVADDDRSYYDAVFVGQRIYRRDLLTGDSALVYEDSVVPAMADAYAAAHPHERPLGPDEDESDDPLASATVELDVVDLFGPYLSVEYRSDIHTEGGDARHATRHGVIDLRNGRAVTLAELFGAERQRRLLAQGRQAFGAALDSVLASTDARGRRAAEVLDAFELDPQSFTLIDRGGEPAVLFLVPGKGDEADGMALPLAPVTAGTLPEWTKIAERTRPDSIGSGVDRWTGPGYRVLARYDSAGASFALVLQDTLLREWPAARLPAPAQRRLALDDPPIDRATRDGLERAFDEAVLYSEDARTVRHLRPRAPFTIVPASRGIAPRSRGVGRDRAAAASARSPRRANLVPRD
jgi:hypothetical protein